MNKGTVAILILIVVVAVVAAFLVYRNTAGYAQQQAQIAAAQQQQAQLDSAYSGWFNSGGLNCNPFMPNSNCGGGKTLFKIDSSSLLGFL